jgi:hypothetical protein
MSLAKKSKSLNDLEKGLNDFGIPTDDNPRNQYFAADLFSKFGSRTQAEQKTVAEVKKKV